MMVVGVDWGDNDCSGDVNGITVTSDGGGGHGDDSGVSGDAGDRTDDTSDASGLF